MLIKKVITICSNCNTINEEDAKYCKECGHGNELTKEVTIGDLYKEWVSSKKCPKCGRPMQFGSCTVCDNIMFYKKYEIT